MPDDTPLSVKKDRLNQLQTLIKGYANEYSQAMINQTYPVLVTGTSKKSNRELTGRTENNRIVNLLVQLIALAH